MDKLIKEALLKEEKRYLVKIKPQNPQIRFC